MKSRLTFFTAVFLSLSFNTASIAGELTRMAGEQIAAEIQFVDTTRECTHRFSGTFSKNDAAKIINARPSLLCLDSPGGSFVEALKVTSFMKSEPFATKIEKGARCESACALVFMAGSHYPHESEVAIAWRVLHPQGKLGFHSPALIVEEGVYDEKTIQKAYQLAMQSVSKLVFDLVHRPDFGGPAIKTSLLGEMLATPSHSMYYVETVDQAGRWGITVSGLEKTGSTNRKKLAVVCVNVFYWDDDQSAISQYKSYLTDWMTNEQLTAVIPFGTSAEIVMSEMTGSGCTFEVNEQFVSARIKADGRNGYTVVNSMMYYDPSLKLVDLPLDQSSLGESEKVSGLCFIIKDDSEIHRERCEELQTENTGKLSKVYSTVSGARILIEVQNGSTLYNGTKTSKPFQFDGKTCVINPILSSVFCFSRG